MGQREFFRGWNRLQLADRESGLPANPVLIDANTQLPLTDERYMFAPGPKASEKMRERLAEAESRSKKRLAGE